MPIRLVRRPRSPRVLHSIIRTEVREAWKQLAADKIKVLQKDVYNWSLKPRFISKVTTGRVKWHFRISYDARTIAGRRYGYVDKGTSVKGGWSTKGYNIYPRKKKALAFDVPHLPKTTVVAEIPGLIIKHGKVVQEHVIAKKVHHRGITPRHFTQSIHEELANRNNPKGLHMVTEAAIKRGIRKMGRGSLL
jgi:hypothetical protein